MFARAKLRSEDRPAAGAATARPMPSIIGPDMKVLGNLATPGEIHVDGEVEGDVSCAKLTVGATGLIRGAISATSVRVHGRVAGSITADEVFLLSGAGVNGDIIQITLEIAPGAEFEGAVRRMRRSEGATLALPAGPSEAPIELTQEAPEPAAAAGTEAAAATSPGDDGDERRRAAEQQQRFRHRRNERQAVPNGAA